MIYGISVGGSGLERTFILQDENGNEYPAVFVENEVVFTATANDIRAGKIAANETGIVEGTKEIPAYYAVEGYRIIPDGARFVLPIEYYDYTKLQAVFCVFNTNVTDSVAVEKVAILDHVYSVQSTESECDVSKDHENHGIDFGFTNDSGKSYLIRYFLYKETY